VGPREELTAAPPPSWGHGLSALRQGLCVAAGGVGALRALGLALSTPDEVPGASCDRCRASLPQVTLIPGVCSGEKHRKKPCAVFTLRVSWQVAPGRVKDEAERRRARWRRALVRA